jgi:hypothetical protein
MRRIIYLYLALILAFEAVTYMPFINSLNDGYRKLIILAY